MKKKVKLRGLKPAASIRLERIPPRLSPPLRAGLWGGGVKKIVRKVEALHVAKRAQTHPARRLIVKDNVNTDYVISGRYKFKIQDPKELARYIFEDIDPAFAARVCPGDILIAGENFGCGSSREQAPQALKMAGFSAVLAKSFARIFYRNAFNIGLMLIECNTSFFDDGDEVAIDIERCKVDNVSKGLSIDMKPVPRIMKRLLDDGGVIEHFRKHGGFKFE